MKAQNAKNESLFLEYTKLETKAISLSSAFSRDFALPEIKNNHSLSWHFEVYVIHLAHEVCLHNRLIYLNGRDHKWPLNENYRRLSTKIYGAAL